MSVHSTSIAPKFWIELRRFTITPRPDIAIAPFERHTDTIIGSISGVRPTATASAKKNASCQLCLVNPLIRNTAGTMTAMKAIISQVNLLIPRSNAVGGASCVRPRAIVPNSVRAPVRTTTAVAEPLWTLVPRKQRFGQSSGGRPVTPSVISAFSAGSDSPVSADWLTNRSFAARSRTSPGIMSPAARTMTSPGTMSRSGTSRGTPSRIAVAVTRIMARSDSAAVFARDSCTNRSATPRTIIKVITMAARRSPVASDTPASVASRITSGLRTAWNRRIGHRSGRWAAISFGP